MVHQHFMLVPVMTVAENLVLGAEPRSGALLDVKAAGARLRELSERYGLTSTPTRAVEDISRRRAAARRDPPGAGTAARGCSSSTSRRPC